MKIMHLSSMEGWRGGEQQLLTTAIILRDYEDIDQIICCIKDSVLQQKCNQYGIAQHAVTKKNKYSLNYLQSVIKALKKNQPDILHVHDSIAFTICLIAIKFFPAVKFVYSRKRNNPIKSTFFKRRKYNSQRISGIICVSQAVKDVLTPIVRDDSKIKVIYDAIDTEKFKKPVGNDILKKEFSLPESTTLIGNIAGLTRQKDIYTFIDTAKKVIDNTYDDKPHFFLIGSGPLMKELKEYTAKSGIEEYIHFAGFRSNIPELLKNLDIFLITSETEGLPLVVMEAFASKIPVVATNAGGTGEAVINNQTGFLCDVKDANCLAENILKLLRNPELKDKPIQKAYDLVNEKFSLKLMSKNYYNFYKDL